MPCGRKPRYTQEHARTLPDLMSHGESVCFVCKKWNISRTTFHVWLEKYPEFATAYDLASTLCQAWWEEAGRQGMYDKTFTEYDEKGNKTKTTTLRINDRIWIRNMVTRFKDWRVDPNDGVASQDEKISKEIRDRIAQVFCGDVIEASKVAVTLETTKVEASKIEPQRIEAPTIDTNKIVPEKPKKQNDIDWEKVYEDF